MLRLPLPTQLVRGMMRVLALPREVGHMLGFRLQMAFMGSIAAKLLMFFAVGIPLCLLGGLAYSAASGRALVDGVVNAYGALYKVPGPCSSPRHNYNDFQRL